MSAVSKSLPRPDAPTSVAELFHESEQRVFRRTDKLFFTLFAIQWLAGIAFALIVSPRAWTGAASSIHAHVYAAIFLGGACCLVPMLFCWKAPGQVITRHVVAVGQTAFSALLIHLTGGRIETHFHVFGSLAFLACYRDWRVLMTATVVVAGDHFVRGIWYPMSVYGVVLSSPWRVAEHALWVVFEDIILIWSCRVSRQEMMATCETEHQNRRILANLETIVRERTAELEAEVSERRRGEAATLASEERYRALVVNSPQIIMKIDRQYSIHFINRTVEGLTHEKVIGSNFLEYHPPNDQQNLRLAFEDVFQFGQTRTLEVVGPGPSGSTAWYSLTLAPLREGDKITSSIILATDITQRHNAETELIKARDLAESGNRAKSEFLATMSHELRTPMNGVIGFTSLLMQTPLNNEQREFAKTIQASGESLLMIINDILDISKIESGKFELQNGALNVGEMVESVAEVMLPKAEEKGLELAIWQDPAAPAMIETDGGRLRQILLNLIGNAIKFTDAGHILIQIENDPNSETPSVRINVRDTGIGIPREKQALLFQKFTQIDGSMTRKFGGTGLGLAICKQLIELMGGCIGVESAPGHGSNFWVTHPAATGPSSVGAAPPPRSLDGLRILIVDDAEVNRQALGNQLRQWNIPYEAASSGPLALEILRSAAAAGNAFQIALVDHAMPHMDGVALAQRVKSDPAIADTALALLVSGSHRAEAPGLLSNGFARFLCKPVVRAGQLLDAITSVWTSLNPAPAAPTRKIELAEKSSPVPKTRDARIHVLLAEDNPVNQRVILLHLKKLDCSVECAENGKQAVEMVQHGDYDCVFMDILMPEMDGLEATERMRALPGAAGRIPIIAVTANAMPGDRERCLAAGMDDYISKPIQASDLSRALQKWSPVKGDEAMASAVSAAG